MALRKRYLLLLPFAASLLLTLVVIAQRENPINYASAQNGGVVTGPQNASGSSGKPSAINDGEVVDYRTNAGYGWAFLNTPLTVTLKDAVTLNKIEILFLDLDSRSYRYRVEVSADDKVFETVADCTREPHRGWQTWVLEPRSVKVVRVTVTATTLDTGSYHVVELAAWNQNRPEEPSPLRRKFEDRDAFLAKQLITRPALLALEGVMTSVLGNAEVMRQARNLREAEALRLDTDHDDDPDMIVWREGRNIIAGLDEDDDMKPDDARPDTDSDCWVADYRGDGEMDRVVDYIDHDGDGDADTSVLYLLTSNVWSARDMTCVVIADLDDDNKMWRLVDYEYNQDVCQWQCDFTGNEWFSMGHYDERQRRWISWLENPFCFYDLDGDGDPEVAVRYSGNDLALRSLRYSFDVDNDATPDSPKDYDFSITALGSVQCPEELATTFPLRGGGKLTYVSWEHARELAEWAPWSRAELCWDENDNNVNPNGPERVHERWEGVIAHGSKLFPQEGGPSCGPFNKRYEVDNDFSGRMGLYLSGIDHRFHLRGAELGWLDADYDNNGRVDMRFRYEDTDGNGFFDTWHVDSDADGKEEWSARFPDEQVRLVSWDYREMRQSYTQVLARATYNQARRLPALRRRDDPRAATVNHYWKEGLPGFYAAEKVRGSREGARYYRDLMLAELATKRGVPVFAPDGKYESHAVTAGLRLTNPLPFERRDEPVVLSLSKLPEVRAALRRDCPFVALREGSRLAAAQADDLNGDGVFDEVVFQTNLAARETRTVTLIANPPHPPAAEKKTAANLYMGASLGWESNLIAYRSYYGKIDLFGKKGSLLKLRDLKGAYHREADWGMDILHLGPSAGVGGLYLWSGGKPIPAMNEEGQRENVKITKRVVVDGDLRSIVEVKLEGLRTPRGVFNLTRRFSIYADGLFTEEQLTIAGGDGGDTLYSPGLLCIEGERFERGQIGALSYVCNWGKQTHPDVSEAGEIGLALITRPDTVVEVAATEHDHVLRCRSRSGKSQRQYLVADWAKGKRHTNAEQWRAFVADLSQRLAAPVKWSREAGT